MLRKKRKKKDKVKPWVEGERGDYAGGGKTGQSHESRNNPITARVKGKQRREKGGGGRAKMITFQVEDGEGQG